MPQPEPKDRKPGRPDINRTWDYWHRTDKCHTVTLYIPSKLSNGDPIGGIDRDNLIRAAMNFFLIEMGGATQTQGVRYYVQKESDAKVKVHEEDVTFCTALCTTETFVKQRDNLRRLANSFAIEFKQDAFEVVIDGRMHSFSPTPSYERKYKKMARTGAVTGKSGYKKYIDASLDDGGE